MWKNGPSLRYLLVTSFTSAGPIYKLNRMPQPQLHDRFDTFTVVQIYSVFRRLLSGHHGSSGGRQRSQLCPRRLGALRPSALVYLHSDASMPDCWCSLNRQEEDEPDARLHSAGIETCREKEKHFLHNILLKNYHWHDGISFVKETTSNNLNLKAAKLFQLFKSVACFYDHEGNF